MGYNTTFNDDIEEEYDEHSSNNPFHDGKLHVLDDKCSSCVFRAGNLMHLSPGRLKDMTDGAQADDSYITCHQTLDFNHDYDAQPAVCRGFYDQYSTNPIRIAQRLDIIEFDPQPKKS